MSFILEGIAASITRESAPSITESNGNQENQISKARKHTRPVNAGLRDANTCSELGGCHA